MIEIGTTQTLSVIKQVDFGFYLDGENLGEILLPRRYAPSDLQEDDTIEVFLYLDSEDRPIATTEKPYVQLHEVAHLRVVSVGEYGAFLDWGLSKDLFVPFKEMRIPMLVGKSYSVFVFEDSSGRLAASSRLSKFLHEENEGDYEPGDKVRLHIASRSDIGYKAVIDGQHLGLIHTNEIFQPIRVGDELVGFVKSIREDDRINLTLRFKNQDDVASVAERILAHLSASGGSTTITDKSPPEAIYEALSMSKATYKKALGSLYKEKKILLTPEKISLVNKAE